MTLRPVSLVTTPRPAAPAAPIAVEIVGQFVALSSEEYALLVAALRTLEDEMQDCGTDDATEIATEAALLRARLRHAWKAGQPA